MRRTVASILLGSFVLFALPGMAEVFENLVHVVQTGHGAHAADTADKHDDMDAEHGCTGAVHLCPCHFTSAHVLTAASACDPVLRPSEQVGGALGGDTRPGFVRDIDHPPSA